MCVYVCLCVLYSMKQPEYQCYRTRAGSAKTLEDFEEIAAELKQHLLVRGHSKRVLVYLVQSIQFMGVQCLELSGQSFVMFFLSCFC